MYTQNYVIKRGVSGLIVLLCLCGCYYTVDVHVEPPGAGEVHREPDQERYRFGTRLNLTAQASPDYQFYGWEADHQDQNISTVVTVNRNMQIIARFVERPAGDLQQPLAQYAFPIDSGDEGMFTTMQSDMGPMGGGDYEVSWEDNAIRIVTRTVNGAGSWGGFYHSVNEKANNANLTLDPAAPLPWPIKDVYQPQITGMYVVARGEGDWRIELIQADHTGEQTEIARWERNGFLAPDFTEFQFAIDEDAPPFKLVNIVAETDSDIWVDEIGLILQMPEAASPLHTAFLFSLGQLLRCYDPDSGFVRDHSNWPVREEEYAPDPADSRSFNVTPGLGFVALAVACAVDLGVIAADDAEAIVQDVGYHLLTTVPVHDSGFLPHYTRLHKDGSVDVHPASEITTVDTALAYLCAYTGAAMLGIENMQRDLLDAVRALDFDAVTLDGHITHGFDLDGNPLTSNEGGVLVWTDFGGETTLLHILAAMNDLCRKYEAEHQPPVFRNNGFIAEMAALIFPHFGGDPAYGIDAHGVDWHAMRAHLLAEQKAALDAPHFIGGYSSSEIVSHEGLHGYNNLAMAFDETDDWPAHGDFGAPEYWAAPHYRLMTAALEPEAAIEDINAMCTMGLMHPLCGPAESVLWNPATGTVERWHSKQIAINAFFSALGAYHAIATRDAEHDNAVYQTVADDIYLNGAAEAVFTDYNPLPTSIHLEAEDGVALPGSERTIMQRSEADGLQTRLLHAGEGFTLPVEIFCYAACSAVVRYSNDNDGPLEEVCLSLVDRLGTEHALGCFDAQDTGSEGQGWNIFFESDALGPITLAPGHYNLQVVCSPDTGDGYGVEIDSITLYLDDTGNNKTR